MISYQFNGKTHVLSSDELHSAGETHTWQFYAYGEAPQFALSWQRYVYANHATYDIRHLSLVTGQTQAVIVRFLIQQKIRKEWRKWAAWEDIELLRLGPRAFAKRYGRGFEGSRSRQRFLRKQYDA